MTKEPNIIKEIKKAIADDRYIYIRDSKHDFVIANSKKEFFEENKAIKVFKNVADATFEKVKKLVRSDKIKELIDEGVPQKQADAIAYTEERKKNPSSKDEIDDYPKGEIKRLREIERELFKMQDSWLNTIQYKMFKRIVKDLHELNREIEE